MKILTLIIRFVLVLFCATASFGQQAGFDQSSWQLFANRAEQVVKENKASAPAMERLLQDAQSWQKDIEAEIKTLTAEITPIEEQLAAATEGATGADAELQVLEAELKTKYEELKAQVALRTTALARVKNIISAAEADLRDQQRSVLLERGMPLSLTALQEAVTALNKSVDILKGEIKSQLDLAKGQNILQRNTGQVIFWSLVTLGLLFLKGRVEGSTQNLFLSFAPRFEPLYYLLRPWIIGAIYLLSFYILTRVLHLTGVLGFRSTILVDKVFDEVVRFTFVYLSLRSSIFVARAHAWTNFGAAALGVSVALAGFWENWQIAMGKSEALLPWVVVAVTALAIMGLGVLPASLSKEKGRLRRQMKWLIYAVSLVLAFGLLSAYWNGSLFLATASAYSVALAALANTIYRLISQTLALRYERSSTFFKAMDVGIILILWALSLPILMLIWGTRQTTLATYWTKFVNGFSFGSAVIKPMDFITFAVIFALGYLITRAVQRTMRDSVLPLTNFDLGGQNAIVSGVGYIGVFVAALIAISSTSIDLSSLAIVAGALSVGLGFGLQNIVSNFVSGVILLVERPIAEGDWIEVGGSMGVVQRIAVRSTRIETFDRTDVIIPNADLISGVVTNWTRNNSLGRLIVPVGVSYDADTRKVEEILLEIGRTVDGTSEDLGISVNIAGFGDSAINFELRMILSDVGQINVIKTEVHHRIMERFREEGIDIPFPHIELRAIRTEGLPTASS